MDNNTDNIETNKSGNLDGSNNQNTPRNTLRFSVDNVAKSYERSHNRRNTMPITYSPSNELLRSERNIKKSIKEVTTLTLFTIISI